MTFPVGFHDFHKDTSFNFTLNARLYNLGGVDYETVAAIGKEVHDFKSWVSVVGKAADRFRNEGNYQAAAACAVAALLYMTGEDFCERDEDRALKDAMYKQCMADYEHVCKENGLTSVHIPFEDYYLPALYKRHASGSKGDVVMHGGYDSFMQEFVPLVLYFYENGYNVYLFEGFGQGEVLNKLGKKMRPEWELCVKPVLDYFELDGVTLIGASLGGYLAARAAAYEPRIKRVVLWDLIYDFYGSIAHRMPTETRELIEKLMKEPENPMWKAIWEMTLKNNFSLWLFNQGRHIYGNIETLYDYFKCIQEYNTRTISPLIKQDVLVLAGEDDLYTVYFQEQIDALTSAASVSGRIFTREEHASHHCQIGNLKLAFDYVLGWMDTIGGGNL
jgi:pimeloyl-ACP methyl ester carboxylesterase